MWHSFCVYMIYFCNKYVQELQLAVYAFNFTLLAGSIKKVIIVVGKCLWK